MNILVTGGAGFIGTNFVRWMLEKHPDYRLINVDKLAYVGSLQNLSGLEKEKNHVFAKGNICERGFLEKLFSEHRIDAVVNFAAETHVDRSILDPGAFLESNVKGVQVLLELSRNFGIKKFVQISTDEVYGSSEPGERLTEDSLLRPNSPYSASKAAADLMCRAYFKTYGLPLTITRSSNNYGPYQFPEKLIPLVLYNSLHDKKIPVYGDGRNVRDWLHVEDNCSAIDTVLNEGKAGETYNVSAGCQRENIEVVKLILKRAGKSEELIQYVEDRPAHDRRYDLDSSKITRELGWKPTHRFERGVEKTVNWYLDNLTWLENCITEKYLSYCEKIYGEKVKDA